MQYDFPVVQSEVSYSGEIDLALPHKSEGLEIGGELDIIAEFIYYIMIYLMIMISK